jgi:hypothetical protein
VMVEEEEEEVEDEEEEEEVGEEEVEDEEEEEGRKWRRRRGGSGGGGGGSRRNNQHGCNGHLLFEDDAWEVEDEGGTAKEQVCQRQVEHHAERPGFQKLSLHKHGG